MVDLSNILIDDILLSQERSHELVRKLGNGNNAFVIHNVFTVEECHRLRALIDERDRDILQNQENDVVLETSSTQPKVRDSKRLYATSEKFSQQIFQRLLPVLRQLGLDCVECTFNNEQAFTQNGLGMRGKWHVQHLKPELSLIKYSSGGHFAPHYDADDIVDPFNHRSLKSVLMYLNDDYVGGETSFVLEHDLYFDKQLQIYCTPVDSIFKLFKAQIGDCLIFDHKMLHEGRFVSEGSKYIIRSDLFYLKEEPQDKSANEVLKETAMRVYYEGTKLEEKGQVDAAIAKYRKAFKMCPEIEEYTYW